ncbi:diguanylate cyclase [Methylomonas lenta]|uniref:Diguanylate cyclase n=1 Tax=Methylomonas lenta TaxID=980561 RepID=A0A177NDA7_9GAMM|nr:bifunctional diguanylate cyclase/phosphodiesterase [Methylomonas lenta]OAI15594.1 diguanylate cyclase [Methylomonas lenta]
MNGRHNTDVDSGELRQRAERQLAEKPSGNSPKLEQRLLHELQVHQIELEMQNEALREAQTNAEQALERYAELFDFAPIAYFSLGRDGIIRQTNFCGSKLLGSERSNLVGRHFVQYISQEDRHIFNLFLDKVFTHDGVQRCELTLQNDCWIIIEASADTSRQSCLAAVLDISNRKQNEQELQLAATIYLALEEAITVTDQNDRIIAINRAFTNLTGYTAEEVIGQTRSLLKSGRQDNVFYQTMWNKLNTTGKWQGEIWNRRKNGEEYLEYLSINTLYSDKGKIIRRVATSSDITEKKRTAEIVHKQANIDPLTELPNRRMFLDRLQQAISKTHRGHKKLALMFLDLDHFKDVNDSLGHDMGDLLLKEVTQRMLSCIRETDTLARPGGDEFTLIMGELHDTNSIERVAQSILQAMMVPFQLKGECCHASVSIGIALYPDDADNLEELLKKADQAMYAAKDLGRSRFSYFTPAMQEAAEIRLRLTNDLRHAMDNHQIWVAYQPIVDLATGEISKAEALIRWQHPARGLISPAEFMPVAEDTGLITELGEWVFHQVAKQVADWRVAYYPLFQVSINKSSAQFHNDADKLSDWLAHLEGLGLPGGCIAVEITEGLLLDTSSVVSEKLLALKSAGVQTSLDNFGTGYSALAYLKKYHIDFLKIDRTFVSNLTANSSDMALCQAIILIAHTLGMKVIAEGVETDEQRDLLLKAGCDYGQGYLFSKPVTAEEFEKLINPALNNRSP